MCFLKYVGKEDVVNFINHVEKRMDMELESLVAVYTLAFLIENKGGLCYFICDANRLLFNVSGEEC